MQLDFQRYELKYIIPDRWCSSIVEFARPYIKEDPATAKSPNGRYIITSLYLDSPGLMCHLAKSRRETNRFKLRIRTYDSVQAPDAQEEDNANKIFFEIKRKIKSVIFKQRVQANHPHWLDYSPGTPGFLTNRNSRNIGVMREFMTLAEQHAMQPQSLVRYSREAYESLVDDYGRITFDRELACHEPEGYRLRPSEQQWLSLDDPVALDLEGGTVLELKFAGRAPQWMADLVQYFGLQKRGFSKYSTSVSYSAETHRFPLMGRVATYTYK